jgi:hypothetical protein
MAKIKLTLSIDDELLTKVKRISKRRGKSLSSLTEDFYKAISMEKKEQSLAKRLMGCASGEMSGMSDAEIRKAYMSEKHG